MINTSLYKRHKKKNLYTISEAWQDSIVECNKNDFYKNFAELMVSQFFSSFFDHRYKSKKTISQVLRSGGLYQDRIMEEKPEILNVAKLEYKFNCPIVFLKNNDYNLPFEEHKKIAQRCHIISQNFYQNLSTKIFQDIKNLGSKSLDRIVLLLWITEKSTVLSYTNKKPKEFIRNDILDIKSNMDFNEEVKDLVSNEYQIFYKTYDPQTKTNSIRSMDIEEFINFRSRIKDITEKLSTSSMSIESIFNNYKPELDILSNSFENHISDYKDFSTLSIFIRNDIKQYLNNMNNYANFI